MDDTSPRQDQRARITEVAARLLQEEGATALTTRGVAQAAGVQAPTIYRLFGDKDGLLEAVAEHVMTAHVSAKLAVVAAATAHDIDPLDDLKTGWMTQIEFGIAHPALFTLMSDPQRGQRSAAVASGRRVLEARVQRVAAAGRLRVTEQRAVQLISAAGVGTVVVSLSSPVGKRDAGLATAMYEAVLGQILTDAPAPADAGPFSTAVAFRALAPRLDVLSDAERRLLAEWLDRVV
ncbi:MAG: helix-turn-helix domain-containing protein, partial [Nakamurella sp.]